MTPEQALELVPIAAQLVGTVRDYGPDDVAAVLARVPDGRHDALAVVLAAMVDPDRRAPELLAWIDGGPVESREEFEPPHLRVKVVARESVPRAEELRAEVERLTSYGLTAGEVSETLGITKRSVYRCRADVRAAKQAVA